MHRIALNKKELSASKYNEYLELVPVPSCVPVYFTDPICSYFGHTLKGIVFMSFSLNSHVAGYRLQGNSVNIRKKINTSLLNSSLEGTVTENLCSVSPETQMPLKTKIKT